MAFDILENGASGTVIKVIGVGGAGGNALNNMIRRSTTDEVEYIAANTDRQALSQSMAKKLIQLGSSGLGAGARPEMGAQAANEAREEIAEALRGANMVFITAGMGGGTGTGAAPIIAEVSQELGILTVAVVTKPFGFEGSRRMRNAEAGLAALKNRVHSLIVILNDKLEEELGEDATMKECFEKADEVLYNACSGIAEIIYAPGIVNADFEDVRTVMSERGTAMMGAAEAEGPDRAITAASEAIACPLLEGVTLKGAKGVLVNITASDNLKQSEVRRAMETIRNFADQDANFVYGAVLDENMGDRMRVTVIATGLDQTGTDGTYINKQQSAVANTGSGVWEPHPAAKPAENGADLFGQTQRVAKPVAPQWNPENHQAPKTAFTYVKPAEVAAAPVVQSAPVAPAAPAAPVAPVTPVAPVASVVSAQEPVAPVAPVTPAAPEPVVPAAPVAPATPVTPAAPVEAKPVARESISGGLSRPISLPDGDIQMPAQKNDNTIFGNMIGEKQTVKDIFVTLGGGQGSGVWTSNAPASKTAEEEEKKDAETEVAINIPSFLRKPNN